MNESARPGSLNLQAWLIFVLVTTCYALTSFFRTAPGSLAVEIMNDFAVGGSLMAIISSAFFYPYAIMQIPAGILADRWGARRTISFFLLLGGIGSLIFALAHSPLMATAGRILTGVGMAMVFVPALRVILNWFPPRMHIFLTGLLLSLGMVGMLCATWPLMELSALAGWRNAMAAAAIFVIVMAILVWLMVRDAPCEKGFSPAWQKDGCQTATCPPLRISLSIILKNPAYWTLAIWFFCLYGSFFSFTGLWAGPFFIKGYGLDATSAGSTLLCLAMGAAGGPALIGFVEQYVRVSKTWLLIAACVFSILLGCPMLSSTPIIPPQLLYAWGLCFGITCGGFGGIALSCIQDAFPSSLVGTATGMINIYTYLGSAFLQVVAGFLVDSNESAGLTGLQQYTPIFKLYLGMTGCALAASILALGMARQKKRKTFQDNVAETNIESIGG